MTAPHFILASASPRRVELLRQFSFPFSVVPSRAEELHDPARSAKELCEINAERKAQEVAEKQSQPALILGADTLVTLDGALFGKPRDHGEAVAMLSQLSGRTHQVITGVCLIGPGDRKVVFSDETLVTFKTLKPDTIETYLRAVQVLDKAGSYGIQERGEMLVETIEGSLSNVIGLPVERLAEALQGWNIISSLERDRIVGLHR